MREPRVDEFSDFNRSSYFHSDAIVLYRAPQLANKFEANFVKFDGKTKDDLNNFVKKNL